MTGIGVYTTLLIKSEIGESCKKYVLAVCVFQVSAILDFRSSKSLPTSGGRNGQKKEV